MWDMQKYPKIELHVHLDGAMRISTILELAKKKKIPLPADDEASLRKHLISEETGNLERFLEAFQVFMPVAIGDKDAIERIAYEFCESQSQLNVMYAELRYSPHLLSNTVRSVLWDKTPPYHGKGNLTPEEVVEAVNKGMLRGRTDFNLHTYSILCCMQDHPDWSEEVLRLCTKHRSNGVVGIDKAGGNTSFSDLDVHIFQEAERREICRTVHAGEIGTAECVKQAITQLHVNRIGHGYRIFQDSAIYELAKKQNVHFEVCPLSSVVTGAVDPDWKVHPVRKLLEDKANFSINTDDPTILGNDLNSEFQLCMDKLGFTEQDLFDTISAARSIFIEDEEMKIIEADLRDQWPMSKPN